MPPEMLDVAVFLSEMLGSPVFRFLPVRRDFRLDRAVKSRFIPAWTRHDWITRCRPRHSTQAGLAMTPIQGGYAVDVRLSHVSERARRERHDMVDISASRSRAALFTDLFKAICPHFFGQTGRIRSGFVARTPYRSHGRKLNASRAICARRSVRRVALHRSGEHPNPEVEKFPSVRII